MIGGTPFSTVPSGGIWNLCSLRHSDRDRQCVRRGREQKERREERGEVRR